jgi:hypothetical protein
MLDSTAGAEPGDPYTAPPPDRHFVEAIKHPPGRLKIAMMRKDHLGVALIRNVWPPSRRQEDCAKAWPRDRGGLYGFGFRRIEAEHQTDHQHQYCAQIAMCKSLFASPQVNREPLKVSQRTISQGTLVGGT